MYFCVIFIYFSCKSSFFSEDHGLSDSSSLLKFSTPLILAKGLGVPRGLVNPDLLTCCS